MTKLLILAIVAVAAVSAMLPVENLVSDAYRPPPNKVVTPSGIAVVDAPLWLYFWRITMTLTALLFAAIVATFFTRSNARVRWTLAALSVSIAVFHYLTLLFTSSPPGYGIAIYPLFYTISVKGVTQVYLDIGQVLILYAVYNVYLANKLS